MSSGWIFKRQLMKRESNHAGDMYKTANPPLAAPIKEIEKYWVVWDVNFTDLPEFSYQDKHDAFSDV